MLRLAFLACLALSGCARITWSPVMSNDLIGFRVSLALAPDGIEAPPRMAPYDPDEETED